MERSVSKIELVSPAGAPEQLTAAFNAGADSVYLGYKKYGARAYAENFSFKQLRWASDRANYLGKKIYLTLNTIIKDEEIPGLLSFINNYFKICSDGIIIQDMGLLKIITDLYPGIPVHASTQVNIHNTKALKTTRPRQWDSRDQSMIRYTTPLWCKMKKLQTHRRSGGLMILMATI